MTAHPTGRIRWRFGPTPAPATRRERTPTTTRRHLDRLRALDSARQIWLLGPDFRPKTVALRRLG
jgi:hypothetical protein